MLSNEWLRTYAAIALEMDWSCIDALDHAMPSLPAPEIFSKCTVFDESMVSHFISRHWIITRDSTGFQAMPKDQGLSIRFERKEGHGQLTMWKGDKGWSIYPCALSGDWILERHNRRVSHNNWWKLSLDGAHLFKFLAAYSQLT